MNDRLSLAIHHRPMIPSRGSGILNKKSNVSGIHNMKSNVSGIHNMKSNGFLINNKRSQLTIFIIVGIVLILSSFLILYMKSSDYDIVRVSETKDSEMGLYVSECLKGSAKEAVMLVGLQGGIIDHNAYQKVSAVYDPLNSGYLSLYNGSLVLPYWYYQDEDGLESSEMPRLVKSYEGDGSIQDQIEQYINRDIISCIDNFKPFKKEGYRIKIKDQPDSEVIFTDSRVVVELDYPVELIRNNNTESYDVFSTELPVRLKRVYSLAKEIRDAEIDHVFLETQTKNFITAYSRLDSRYLPPMYGGMQFESCSNRVFWLYNDVYDDFRTMLAANIPYIKIANTDYTPYSVSEADFPDEKDRAVAEGIMKNMVKEVSETNYPFITAQLDYDPDFPLELDLGTKGVLEPNSFDVNLLVSKFCLFEYKFFYNVKFPVTIMLVDSKSNIDESPFIFQFPLQVVLKDNFPRVRYSDVFGGFEEDAEPSYQCHNDQRLSGPVTISVADDLGSPVKNARVMFQCGPSTIYDYDTNGTLQNVSRFADKCFIGMTDQDGILYERFPPCIGGGLITVEHDDHLGIMDLIGDVNESESFERNYTLYRVVDKKVSVRKYFVKPPVIPDRNMVDDDPGIVLGSSNEEVIECNLNSDSAPLQEHENVLIRLIRISDDNKVLPVNPFLLYNSLKDNTIRLAPGRYKADLMLVRNERYSGEMTIFRNSEYKYLKGDLFTDSKTIYYPEDDVEIPSTFSGGAEFEFELRPEALYSEGGIIFSIIDEGPPEFIEHIGRALGDRANCTALNWNIMKPKFG
ncbi:hypothetical protein JXB31_04070 [Candidatus Woesearchaeota archaeon]|nr:hypothetical protein [Candidatus Woesearchaeota archaeon]